MPLGLFKEYIMLISFILLSLSLISFGIIKRSEFYKHQIIPKQFFSPILAGLIILKNAVVGFTLIILLSLSLTGPLRAEYSPIQPSINLDDVESGQLKIIFFLIQKLFPIEYRLNIPYRVPGHFRNF